MGPVNWVDGVILLLIAGAIMIGLRVGFFVLLFVIAGFFGGLFAGGWLFPHVLPIHDRTILTIINGNLVLLLAVYVAVRGFDLGRHWHVSFGRGVLHVLETVLGGLLGTFAMLVLVWLLAAMVGRLPFAGFSNSADDAYTVQLLDRHLPSVPSVFAEFNRLVDANTSPQLFTPATTWVPTKLPPLSHFRGALVKAGTATVRITSFGCGGIVSGSGFAVAPDLVATDAHVIAGVHRPIVKVGHASYAAVPILFDASLDFAVLQVRGLDLPWLLLAPGDLKVGTALAAMGYPDGNYAVSPGVIRNNFVVFGRNIYDEGVVGRDIYEIQTTVDEGSSGGPVIAADGEVAGIIFAKSDSAGGYAYAVTARSLQAEVGQAEHSTRRVSTGVCLAN